MCKFGKSRCTFDPRCILLVQLCLILPHMQLSISVINTQQSNLHTSKICKCNVQAQSRHQSFLTNLMRGPLVVVTWET